MVGGSHLLASSAPLVGARHALQGTCGRNGRKRQAAEPRLRPALGIKALCPHSASLTPPVGCPSHPLWCCRSLWMVLKLRKKLRSPTAAFTRYVWDFVQEKGQLPLPQVGPPVGFPSWGGAQSHHQLPALPLCRAHARVGWARGHRASQQPPGGWWYSYRWGN